VANGEAITGNTTMRIDEGLDTGDMLLQRKLTVAPDQTSADIYPLLSEMGADLMVETLAGLAAGTLQAQKQDDTLATLAPILTRDDAHIDFSQPAMTIYNRWRGFQPWPGAWTMLGSKKLTVHRLMPITRALGEPGVIDLTQGRLIVGCGEGTAMELVEVQLEGKKRMAAADFLRGHQLQSGDRLGQ
jgi:methionyl-tRNA formyltransferase